MIKNQFFLTTVCINTCEVIGSEIDKMQRMIL